MFPFIFVFYLPVDISKYVLFIQIKGNHLAWIYMRHLGFYHFRGNYTKNRFTYMYKKSGNVTDFYSQYDFKTLFSLQTPISVPLP